ncbi:MAG: N-formylglutamate amidohydrolase [Candidatus Binatia bacterium]
MQNEAVFDLLNPQGSSPIVLTCEHASYTVPLAYRNLGVSYDELSRHIGWDIGARWVVETLSQVLDAPAVCSGYSRLLIDCNRDVTDHDLIVSESDGTKIQGNAEVTDTERERRITQFYQPYHDAIDQLLGERSGRETVLLSIHSFTPVLGMKERPFDLGVLFDRHEDLAQEVGQRLHHREYRIRYNEPYSGLDGLIFSARSHGDRHGLLYLELEINNGMIAQRDRAKHMGRMLGEALKPLFSTTKKMEES